MNSKKTKTFPQGGIHPADDKLSANAPIMDLPVPEKAVVVLAQHIGKPAALVAQPGQTLKVGDLIAQAHGFISTNVHAPVSGTVETLDRVMDQSGFKKQAVIIKTDGDHWRDDIDRSPTIKADISADRETIVQKVNQAGIIGMGGAGFPSHVKLTVPKGKNLEYLLINGAECEPYLTSDHRLMLEKADELIVGIKILIKALGLTKALVGIEDNKKDAIARLLKACANEPSVEIHPLKVFYPQGGERQLVKALTGREIPPPPKGLPIDVGCAVFNVSTAVAVYEAVQKNKPCVDRIVTVTGPAIARPSNFRVRIGTSIADLIKAAGGLPENTGKVLSGGPMMGKALAQIDIPVTKTMGGIVILPHGQALRRPIQACIRCGRCVSICPLGLEPYLMMALTEKGMYDRAQDERVASCCECGCCGYICPAGRPLVDYIRLGKSIVTQKMKSQKKS